MRKVMDIITITIKWYDSTSNSKILHSENLWYIGGISIDLNL